jgi:DNA polymerase-1
MSKPRVALLTESPRSKLRTRDTVEYIINPLSQDYEVVCLSVLENDPRNGKAATKTELKSAQHVLGELKRFEFVILVGNTPLQLVTGQAGISKRRGKPFKVGKTFYLPMNNPSILHHDPQQRVVLENDLRLFEDMVSFGGIPEERALSIRVVSSKSDFQDMLMDLSGTVSFDIETNSLNPFQSHITKVIGGEEQRVPEPAKIVSLGFGTRKNQWVIPVNHAQSPWTQDEVQRMVDEITEVIEDLVIVAHNGKFDMLWMWVHFGVQWPMAFDTMLAHYLLNENMRHGLKYLAQVYLGAPDWEVDLDTKQGAQSLDKLVKYHAHDLFYTRQLKYVFSRLLAQEPEVQEVFSKILMPSANLFVEIEYDGVFINVDQFEEAERVLRGQYDTALKSLEAWEPKDMVDSRGRPVAFNWGSTQQLADLLYKRLKLPVIERTETGNPSCNESVIKRLDHPCTEALLKFREAKQQLSFFIDGWKPHLHKRPNGHFLHPSFKLHGTVTGRLSCENPNLQQVPRDKRIRTLITAPEGWTLIECDLSQIELRVAAELAGERNMIHAFTHGIDVHWMTALREISRGGGLKGLVVSTAKTWLNTGKPPSYSESIDALLKMGPDSAVEIDSTWKEYRKRAKAVNFGYLYGMWWKKFKDYARDSYGVNISDQEAEASREAFFDNYPDLVDWHERQKRFVRRHGYVMTLSGRKRRLPEALSGDNSPERKAAERQAINSPVQSFANDINLMAALQLRAEYPRSQVRICGTVHDAVLFRVKNEHVPEVYTRMMEIMRRPKLMDDMDIRLAVPIEADGQVGPWGGGTTLEKWMEKNPCLKYRKAK